MIALGPFTDHTNLLALIVAAIDMESTTQTNKSLQEPLPILPVSWETMMMRRRSSMTAASAAWRRCSLLSVGNMFDQLGKGEVSDDHVGHDPFTPLSLDLISPVSQRSVFHGNPAAFHSAIGSRGISSIISDKSESSRTSAPSLSASSYSSTGSQSQTGKVLPMPAISGGFQPNVSPLATDKPPVQTPTTTHPGIRAPLSQPQKPMNTVADDDSDGEAEQRFKPFHEEKWTLRYKELLQFHSKYGHSAVPHTYPQNPQLARWVKRQRRQYKLRRDGRASTMTVNRLEMLESVGFVWDSHDVNWKDKLYALQTFRREKGHCNVPSNFKDKKLATWVKCQRRQYKLYWDGKASAMNPGRIRELEKVGFEWEIRSTVVKKSTKEVPVAKDIQFLDEEQEIPSMVTSIAL